MGIFEAQMFSCTVGHKSDDPCFHKKYTGARVMTFVAYCTLGHRSHDPCFHLFLMGACMGHDFCDPLYTHSECHVFSFLLKYASTHLSFRWYINMTLYSRSASSSPKALHLCYYSNFTRTVENQYLIFRA